MHFQINYPDQSCSSFHKNLPPTHSIATFNGLARGLAASANRLIGSAVIDDSLSPLNTGIRVTFSSEGIYFNYSAGLQLLSTCTELYPRRTLVIPCLCTVRNHWLFCTAKKQSSEVDLGIYASIYFPLLDTDNFTAANYKQVTFKMIYLPTM